jgi:hypothetical protein
MHNVPKKHIPKSPSVTSGKATLAEFETNRCNATKSNKYELTKTKPKKAVGSAWRLLQYSQDSDKNILRHLAGCVELRADIS